MNTFEHLALHDCIAGKARVEMHHGCLEAMGMESVLYPVNKGPVQILEEEDLDVWNIIAVAARDVEAVYIRGGAAMWTGTSSSVGFTAKTAAPGRPGPATVV